MLTFAQSDKPGSKEYPGISRMPGFIIADYREAQFDGFDFFVTKQSEETKEHVEGHLITINYSHRDGAPPVSKLQIIRDLQNAARAAGG